ncbi:hypothetical protein VNO77_33808 [Canavalia gladiata]|uniref:Uncharacterized protein n=1 Tax=Canavalia gladiata TaxID=3824 RepID=A0AAN9KD40_CANGL
MTLFYQHTQKSEESNLKGECSLAVACITIAEKGMVIPASLIESGWFPERKTHLLEVYVIFLCIYTRWLISLSDEPNTNTLVQAESRRISWNWYLNHSIRVVAQQSHAKAAISNATTPLMLAICLVKGNEKDPTCEALKIGYNQRPQRREIGLLLCDVNRPHAV